MFNSEESLWSVTCEEIDTDLDDAIAIAEAMISDLRRLKGDFSRLKRFEPYDKSVLETLASSLRDATTSRFGHLADGMQIASNAIVDMIHTVVSFG